MQDKITDGKEKELWIFDLTTGIEGRIDKRFFEIRLQDRGGYNQLILFEEPLVSKVPAEKRIIGQVLIEKMTGGLIVARTAKGVNGEILELKPNEVMMTPAEFAEKSTDGRSLAALAVARLL